jgi:hypothetical protein
VSLRALWRDERGAVALLGALLLPVLVGAGALVVDLGQYRLANNRMQSAADAGALAAVQYLSDQPDAIEAAVEYAGRNVPESFGEVTRVEDVTFGSYDPASRAFTPSTENVNAIRVTARRDAGRGNAAPRLLSAIWGDEGVAISATAIAARTVTSVYERPELTNLNNEAGDYNIVHAYCFDQHGTGPVASRRSQMTAIAHNIRGAVTYTWPECRPGETMSFRLQNFISSRANAEAKRPITGKENNYYSDTIVEDGRETFGTGVRKIIETVRCDSLQECKSQREGGVVPFGRNRRPVLETRPCVPGKYMYYGWEDRPTGDADFDDIVFVMKCPTGRDVAYGASRLVR